MRLKPETTGFVRGGMLFLEPPARWRSWQRDVWSCGAVDDQVAVWICRDCHACVTYRGNPHFCVRCRGRRLFRNS